MTSTNIDYVDTYFELPTLTKIHGEPTYFQLKELKNELKSNATSVTTDLGGGGHGHLGLVLTPAEYATISAVAYTRPVHPGPLIIPPGTAQHEASRLREEHSENFRIFLETIDVEKALINHLVAAIEPKYIKSLRNVDSNAIDIPLHQVLQHLFNRFGDVNADTLMDIEEKVKTMEYNLSELLVTIFNEIEALAGLGVAANNAFSDMQQVQIGLRIIKNTNDFEKGIQTWYERPVAEHTWQNFKTHFDTARELLRKIRGVDMQNSAFQQANLVAEEVRADIARSEQTILEALALQTQQEQESEQANAVVTTSDATQLAILQLLKEIKVEMNKSNTANSNKNRPKFYCWSHGRCGHKSADCRNKKAGHKDDATFANKMNGSLKGCTTE